MKRKELQEYIRQEIINELTPAEQNAKNIKKANATKDITDLTKKLSIEKDPKHRQEVQADLAVAKEKLAAANSMTEIDLDEMARKAGAYKIGNAEKFAMAKEIYTTGLYADILAAFEEAGENGLTKNQLGEKVGESSSSLTDTLLNFKAAGVLSGGKLAAASKDDEEEETEEPETPEVEEPETEEEPTDDWEAPEEEEETSEEEPEITSKASNDLGKWAEELAGLKKQLKVIMDKYRDANGKISDIEKYKQEVGNIPQKIKALDAKLKSISE